MIRTNTWRPVPVSTNLNEAFQPCCAKFAQPRCSHLRHINSLAHHPMSEKLPIGAGQARYSVYLFRVLARQGVGTQHGANQGMLPLPAPIEKISHRPHRTSAVGLIAD